MFWFVRLLFSFNHPLLGNLLSHTLSVLTCYDDAQYIGVWKKIVAILQMTISNAFSWRNMFAFQIKFHWNLFLKVWIRVGQLLFGLSLLAWNRTGKKDIAWIIDGPVHWHNYLSTAARLTKKFPCHNSCWWMKFFKPGFWLISTTTTRQSEAMLENTCQLTWT